MKRVPMPSRRSPMARSTALTRGVFQRKRARRNPEETAARKAVRARSGGICELCGTARATNFQHRQGKAQQGAWTAQNGLDVCGQGNATGCHGRIHQRPAEAYANGWSVRSGQDPATTPAFLHGVGRVLLTPTGTYLPVEENAA